MNVQDAKELNITEGDVRTIHDSDGRQLWGRLAYDVKYEGDTTQQTYSGKNLYDYTDTTSVGSGITVGNNGWVTVSYDNTNGTEAHYESYFTDVILQLSTSTNYAVVTEIKDVVVNNTSIKLYSVSGSSAAQFSSTITVVPSNYPNGGTDVHVISTLSSFVSSTSSLRTAISFPAGSKGTFSFRISLLADTSVTPETFSYEPYVGGIPAPNPDYPQTVNVVTGTQTITLTDGVVSDDFTLSLGTTELCKIGDYQDYIYKSGDDWYLHKEVWNVVVNGSVGAYNSGSNWYYAGVNSLNVPAPVYNGRIISNYFIESTTSYMGNSSHLQENGLCAINGDTHIIFRNTTYSSSSDYQTWLNSVNPKFYYALATPTDTQITDATLIGQLDAIHQFLTRYGYSATVSGNLPMIINQTALS